MCNIFTFTPQLNEQQRENRKKKKCKRNRNKWYVNMIGNTVTPATTTSTL